MTLTYTATEAFALRRARFGSQSATSRRTGISQSLISRFEGGQRVRYANAERLARAVGLQLDTALRQGVIVIDKGRKA